jgi:hypothetical protein
MDWYSISNNENQLITDMKNWSNNIFRDLNHFEIECICKDNEGNPICFKRKEKSFISFIFHPYYTTKRKNSSFKVSGISQVQSKPSNKRYIIQNFPLNIYPFCETSLCENLFPDEDSAPLREYQEPNEPNSNPEEYFPDKEIDYPKQDEILDDEPLREIKEPSEKEFESPQEFPGEEENFPGVFPKN